MTGQVSEEIVFNDREFVVAASAPNDPFHPRMLGIPVGWCTTGCWRGFLSRFSIRDEMLHLVELDIAVGTSFEDENKAYRGCVPLQDMPIIQGVNAANLAEAPSFNIGTYRGLSIPVRYTGEMLIGRDRLSDDPRWMGWDRPWDFREVHYLRFDQGLLAKEEDHSCVFEKFRKLYVCSNAEFETRLGVGRRRELRESDGWVSPPPDADPHVQHLQLMYLENYRRYLRRRYKHRFGL